MFTTQKQVRAAFWEFAQENRLIRKPGGQNKQNTDTRCAFVDYVDSLARNGQISDELAQRVTL